MALSFNLQTPQQVGETWIQTLVVKEFQRVNDICQADVISRLMTPKRFDMLENSSDLSQKVAGWFQDCYSIRVLDKRVAMVGEKLGILYRLGLVKVDTSCNIEQQLYCSFRDGRIEKLNLLCSGFQPVQATVEAPAVSTMKSEETHAIETAYSSIQANALLEMEIAGANESPCAFLTPAIKRKLGEMNTGQVLEVRVDDISAAHDIEAWCRLSGNPLLQTDRGAGQELSFFVMKK